MGANTIKYLGMWMMVVGLSVVCLFLPYTEWVMMGDATKNIMARASSFFAGLSILPLYLMFKGGKG